MRFFTTNLFRSRRRLPVLILTGPSVTGVAQSQPASARMLTETASATTAWIPMATGRPCRTCAEIGATGMPIDEIQR